MDLYDIHTHNPHPDTVEGCEIKCIFNTSPQSFAEDKTKYLNLYFSSGIHPWDALNASDSLALLQEVVLDDKVLAIGEVGLDKLRGPDLNTQLAVFRKQIEIAIAVKKPLIIHCVKAWEELIGLYKEYRDAGVSWIIHGYRGNSQQTEQLSKLGFKFSIGEKFNKESLQLIPIDSIFCETDTSNLSICQVYQNISDVIGFELNQFAIFAKENVEEVFS